MPLTSKGKRTMRALKKKHGEEEGERMFHSLVKNKGLKGMHNPHPPKSKKYGSSGY